jgi:DNA mismatch repair ATPase MutS
MSHGWRARLKTWAYGVTQRLPSKYTYQIAERDESGMRALSDIQARGIGQVAATLGRSVDHLMAFFRLLRSELGFLVACLNLHARLARKDEQVCFPDALAATASKLSARDLFDISLSLITDTRAVSNRLEADGKSLVMVTGANGGGKSTFLRSLGQAQIMMQAGMFVPATSFRASLCAGLFTHFKREEDALLRSGKLDEELHRLSAIVDHLKFGCLVLLNESFASTNEREGSEIGRQFVRALLDSGVRMIFVTHLFTLAHGLYLMHREDTLFLRADRRPDGGRTFQLNEGEPLATSHGVDLYRRIFGVDTEDRADPDTPAREEEPKGEPAYVQLRERARSR